MPTRQPTNPEPSKPFGRLVLEALHEDFGFEHPRTQWTDHGFRYWASPIALDFDARPPAHEDALWTFTVTLPVARPFDPTAKDRYHLIDSLNRLLNQFTTHVDGDTLTFRAHVRIGSDNVREGLEELAYRASFLLSIATHRVDEFLAALANEDDAPTRIHLPHPDPDLPLDPSPILESPFHQAVLMGGLDRSPEFEPDLDTAIATLHRMAIGTIATTTAHDMGFETRGFNAVIETRDVTSLLEVKVDEPNPHVGDGLLTTLRVRFLEGHLHGEGWRLARDLNQAEHARDLPMHGSGAWTSLAEGSDVAYSAFYPNLLLHPGLATRVTLENVQRLTWLIHHFGYEALFTRDGPVNRNLVVLPDSEDDPIHAPAPIRTNEA